MTADPKKQQAASEPSAANQEKNPSFVNDILKQKAKDIGEAAVGTSEQDVLYQAEIAALKDQLMRALAEAENIRRRGEREKEEAGKYAVSSFARDMIAVLENLHRTSESVPANEAEQSPLLKALTDGVELTRRELLSVFEKYGIKRIDPVGEPFNHNFHQAMLQVEDPEKVPGTVAQVMQAGYVLHDRLLRPALVSVVKEQG